MNISRILTTAAAGSFLLAVGAPAVQAADLGSTLAGTALTAQTAGQQAGAAAHGVLDGTGVGKKVGTVNDAVQAGAAAVSAGNQLVNG